MNGRAGPVGVVGVGYERRTLDELIRDLTRLGVTVVVDVRLNPISRRPGFSTSGLARALAEAGIGYEHRPQLGNPTSNRAGFAGSPDELAAARAVYRKVLASEEGGRALAEIAELSRRERVALLCYEADQRRCHRDVLIEALTGSGGHDQSG